MKHPVRYCTICMGKGLGQIVATHVAGDADGMEWFECTGHGPTDHFCYTEGDVEFVRKGLVEIGEWFRRVPGYGDN